MATASSAGESSHRISPTTRHWIFVTVALSMVGIVLHVGDKTFDEIENSAFEEFNRRQQVMAESAASAIQFFFLSIAGTLQSISHVPEVQKLNEQAVRDEFAHTFESLKRAGVNDIGILDKSGVVRYTMAAPQLEDTDFSWRQYYRRAKQSRTVDDFFIEFIEFKGVDRGQKGVLVAVPIFRTAATTATQDPSERFVGVLVCTINLNVVTTKFVEPIRPSTNGRSFLIDTESTVLWPHDPSIFGLNLLQMAEKLPVLKSTLTAVLSGTPGTMISVGSPLSPPNGKNARDNTNWLIAYTPVFVGDQTWTLGVIAPNEDARAQLVSAHRSHLLIVGLSILIVMASSAYILIKSLGARKTLQAEVNKKTSKLVEAQAKVNRLKQRLLDHVISSQENERQRVARELHDELSQELAVLLLELDSKTPERPTKVDELRHQLRALIDKVNRIAWDLRPIILDDYGLASALQLHLKKVSEITAVQIDFNEVSAGKSDNQVPRSMELALYRIAQEAVKNAVDHGHPTRISVILVFQPRELTMVIEDDGKGFDVNIATSQYYDHGLGLIGMRERVGLLNGTIAVESSIGSGATVKIVVPFATDKMAY